MLRRTTLVAGLVVALFAAFPQPARAESGPQAISQCGQTIVSDAYLVRDLTCQTGLTVISTEELRAQTGDDGARVDFTLDLRGHRLSGPGTATSTALTLSDLPFSQSIAVHNGRVDHWGTAFVADFASLELVRVRLDHNDTGIDCYDSTCSIDDSVITRNLVGTTGALTGFTFRHNVFRDNELASRAGVELSSTTYTGNVFTKNTVAISIPGGEPGDITNNSFVDNGTAILGRNTTGMAFSYLIRGNVLLRNGDGINVTLDPDAGDVVRIQDNLAVGNRGYGIYAPGAVDLGGNRAARNQQPCVGVVCSTP